MLVSLSDDHWGSASTAGATRFQKYRQGFSFRITSDVRTGGERLSPPRAATRRCIDAANALITIMVRSPKALIAGIAVEIFPHNGRGAPTKLF